MKQQQFTCRRCRPEDFQIWRELNLAFIQEEIMDDTLWNHPQHTPEAVWQATFTEALQSDSMIRLLLFEESGVPAGFANIMLLYSIWSQGKAAFLDDLFLIPEFRGKGYGKLAMEFIESEAVRAGCKRFQFMSEETNPNAKGFYSSLGFRPTDMNFYVKYL